MKKIFRISTGLILVSMIMLLSLGIASAQERYFTENAWSFGVMADTQWYVGDEDDDPEGLNPEFVSAALAKAVQNQFIQEGVSLVVQVGDLTDRAGDAGFDVRAAAAQPLFDAGIGYFPLRGNHETYGYLYGRDPEYTVNVPAYRAAFPQTQGLSNTFGATNFSNPGIDDLKGLSYSFDYGDAGNNARFVIVDVEGTKFIASDVANDPAATSHPEYGEAWYYLGWIVWKSTATVPGGKIPADVYFRISSSGSPSTNFYGFEKTWPFETYLVKVKYDIANTEYWPGTQQTWIDSRLNKATRGTEHAFVFAHRGIMGSNHADGFFGSSPKSKLTTQDPFYASLYNNDVKYMLVGHDHLHNRAIVASPDGSSTVQQTIHMALSTKFYDAAALDGFSDQKYRETQISAESKSVGYYIYTIDGSRVHVDYYTDSRNDYQDYPNYPFGEDAETPLFYMPTLNWVKRGSWGYSHNGQEFVVPQGAAYPVIEDTYNNTMVKVVAGINSSTSTDRAPLKIDDNDTPDDTSDDITLSAPRPLTKVVNTGWQDKDRRERKVYSDIFSIWGMDELGTEKTDEYVIFMKVDMDPNEFRRAFPEAYLRQGKIGVSALNSDGEWVNAVELNIDSAVPRPRPVWGSYDPNVHKLGDWGIVPLSSEHSRKEFGTVWAVVNYNADFAVTQFGQKAACFNCYKKK